LELSLVLKIIKSKARFERLPRAWLCAKRLICTLFKHCYSVSQGSH
jgi:hypothetical protein